MNSMGNKAANISCYISQHINLSFPNIIVTKIATNITCVKNANITSLQTNLN